MRQTCGHTAVRMAKNSPTGCAQIDSEGGQVSLQLYMTVTLKLHHWVFIGLFATVTPTLGYAITHSSHAPEPGNLALLGLGLVSLGLVRQRARRREANSQQESSRATLAKTPLSVRQA